MNSTSSTRVLIVDDEPKVALMLAISLEKLGQDYSFDVAHSGDEAITKLQETPYKLLITDYSMPGMNGLDLIQEVQRIAPATQIILMTAYGTEGLRKTVQPLNLGGFIDKPFTLSQIREIVQRAIERTQKVQESLALDPADESDVDPAISRHLESLRHKSGAQSVLLISSSGYPVGIVGQTKDLDVPAVSALVAGNFLAVAELARMVGRSHSVFKSSYHEGDDYNIYAYDINGEFLLTVICGSGVKPGAVWFYTKQIAADLKPLMVNQVVAHNSMTNDQISASVDTELDKLFGNFPTAPADLTNKPNSPIKPTEHNSNKVIANQPAQPMTFEQAMAAGLVPPQIEHREQNRSVPPHKLAGGQ